MPPSATHLGTRRRRGSDLEGVRSEARATGPRPREQPQEVCGSTVFTLKPLPLIEQISFDLRLLSTQRGGWGSLPYLRQITVTPSKHSTSSKRKTNHRPKASLPSPQIIRNRNAFLSLPCFNKDSPSSFCRLTQLQYHYRFTLQVRDTALNVCRASPRLLITCHSGDLNVRIQPAAVMLVGSQMMKTLDKSRRTRWIHIFGRLPGRDFHSTLTPWSDKWHLQNEQLSNLNCLTVAWSVLLSC